MITRTIQIALLVCGFILNAPDSMASDGTDTSASTSFRISLIIAPDNAINPRLSTASLMTNDQCTNQLEDTHLSKVTLANSDETLARNFFCASQSEYYSVAEHEEVIVLTAIPV